MRICFDCNGRGYQYVPGPTPDDIDVDGCPRCKGTGIHFLRTKTEAPPEDYDPYEKED